MNEYLFRRMKNQLNAKFYVMNDAWLRDCIEFFIKDKTSHEVCLNFFTLFMYCQLKL